MVCGAMASEPQKIPIEKLQDDFFALYKGLESAHFNLYANRSREDYNALFEQTLEEIDTPLTKHEAGVRFQRFVAYGKVAHARIDYDRSAWNAYQADGGKVFPVYLRIVDGRSYVGENYSGEPRLLPGTEILSMNGKPMSEWLDLTARNISADTPYIAHSLLEFLFAMYLWEEAGPVNTFVMQIRDVAGKISEIRVEALSRKKMKVYSDKASDAFALDLSTRKARMLDGDIAYLRPGPFYNAEKPETPWDNTEFVRFIDESFIGFLNAGATALVVDLRQNPGGDNSFSDPMVAWFADVPFSFASSFLVRSSKEARASNQARLDAQAGLTEGASAFFGAHYATVPYGEDFEYPIPKAQPREGKRFEGNICVLIDRHSYSNAVTVAAIVQDYGFGEILGEKTSDMATTYGAMETFSLPNTGLVVGFPKAHIVRPSGERKPDGVTPDVLIQSRIAPTSSDAVLEGVKQHIQSGGCRKSLNTGRLR